MDPLPTMPSQQQLLMAQAAAAPHLSVEAQMVSQPSNAFKSPEASLIFVLKQGICGLNECLKDSTLMSLEDKFREKTREFDQ